MLTFDDGPDPVGTPAVLEALAAHGATATFFVLLTRGRVTRLLARVLADGHEVGLHGVDHRRLTRFSHAEVHARTAAAKVELEAADRGARPLVPAPVRGAAPATWLAARRAGLVPVLWGPTTWDWRELPQADRGARPRTACAPVPSCSPTTRSPARPTVPTTTATACAPPTSTGGTWSTGCSRRTPPRACGGVRWVTPWS